MEHGRSLQCESENCRTQFSEDWEDKLQAFHPNFIRSPSVNEPFPAVARPTLPFASPRWEVPGMDFGISEENVDVANKNLEFE